MTDYVLELMKLAREDIRNELYESGVRRLDKAIAIKEGEK